MFQEQALSCVDRLNFIQYRSSSKILRSVNKRNPAFCVMACLAADNTDYKEWSPGFNKRLEAFKSDEGRFVKFEDRRYESNLTLENFMGISKGKMRNVL